MSLKNELMFPFGNPYKDRLEDHTTLAALSNVVKLAKDKVRYCTGETEEILLVSETADMHVAEQSIKEIEQLLNYINGKKETDTN